VGERIDGLLSELDHVVMRWHTVQAEILAHDGVQQVSEQRVLAGQVSELRDTLRTFSAGLEETFARRGVNRDTQGLYAADRR
jgi:hypothetical protein